jgi:putative ABC transport system ATP-binding protein
VALAGVDLTVDGGEYVAIVGASGSGKTTLVNMVGLLDTPTDGEISYGGDDAACWSDAARSDFRADSIGFVFQSFHLLMDRTVFENVEAALVHQGQRPPVRAHLADAAIDSMGLSHRSQALARTLSGGEQQRTALARALVREPKILICDEPVGNLDEANATRVLDSIGDFHRMGTTVVMVTHHPDVAARADRVVRLADGAVAP